jgi:predicted acetylornithine/succinylornithine family transaminase
MELLDKAKKYLLSVYKPFPIDVDYAKGIYLYDKSGKQYLDFLAGIAVNALGYQHPRIQKAILEQLNRNLHLSNYFLQDVQVNLAEKIVEASGLSKVFFTNSGTEAIEGLLKIIKKWGNTHGKNEIIAFQGGFHGRSLGSLSITIQDKYQKSFLPLLPNIKTVPANDARAFSEAISEQTLAVFYEGIMGEGGVRPVSPELLDAIYEGRKKYGYLVVADEIQTGVGRTGAFYYYQKRGVMPDAIATAKGLGGGLPLGAFVVNEALSNVLQRGEHGTTYGGNPLACASGLATVETINTPDFLKHVQTVGEYFKEQLQAFAKTYPDIVKDVRGEGLMLGLEVGEKALDLMAEGCNQGILFNVAGGTTLRFVPPLIIEEKDVDEAIEKLHRTFVKIF